MPIHPSIHIHLSFCPVSPSFCPSINLIPSNFSSTNFSLCLSLSLSVSLSLCLSLSLSLSLSSVFQFINLSSISLPPICHLSPSHSHLILSALSSLCTTPSQSGHTVLTLLSIQSHLTPVDAHLEAGPHVCQPLYVCPSMHASTYPNPHSHIFHMLFMCPNLLPHVLALVNVSQPS